MSDDKIPYVYKCLAVRVIDGDTLVCEIDLGFRVRYTTSVRLGGIDAYGLRAELPEDKMQGAKAAARLSELIRLHPTGHIRTKLNPFEKYGRVLGWLTLGGIDINKTLVEEGLAKETVR